MRRDHVAIMRPVSLWMLKEHKFPFSFSKEVDNAKDSYRFMSGTPPYFNLGGYLQAKED